MMEKLLCLIGQWGSGKTPTAKQVYKFVTNAPLIVVHNYFTFNVCDRPVLFDDTISKIETDIEKDRFKEKIWKLYENMSRSGTKPFIIITLDEDMKHLYNFVVSFTMQKGREVYRYYKNVNKRGSYSNIALATCFQSKYKFQ